MISELYANDRQLVDCYDTVVKFGVQDKTAQNMWQDYEHINWLSDSNIVSESLEIKQSICDEKELIIGGCIPSQLTLKLIDINEDLSGKRIVVTVRGRYIGELYPSDTLYPSEDLYPNYITTDEYILFIGQIFSCQKTKNYRIRKLVAFDRTHYASTLLCKNRVFNYLKQYDARDVNFSMLFSAFASKARIQLDTTSFVNNATIINLIDSIWLEEIDKGAVFLDFYRWLCELNGVFLIEDQPPFDSLTNPRSFPRAVYLYQNTTQRFLIDSYSSLSYDDFVTKPFRYVQFDFDRGSRYTYLYQDPYSDYSRYLSNNPVTRCVISNEDLDIIGKLGTPYRRGYNISVNDPDTHIYTGTDNVITGDAYAYRPFKASIFNRWWVQVGDRVKLPTDDPDVPYVESIVLSRKIKGIHGMKVEIEAKGLEIMGKENDESIQ